MDRGFLMMDRAEQERSIRKPARLSGVELMATGHSGCTRDFAAAMNAWK
jgi:hypothetical protein